ncbi:DUF3037 domain-containing protein [Foetidibacter luteolus]|uniref:DUF3037 domain-containing protein n=1 Tax=Foetidibacter luteolus TaxID=2608880 RepID=UPI00129A5C69|nr:DUF3037 domain-containing protein [Foetidibacter luteolus]
MPENNLFEYAVIRIVPRVEREEFLNVGVILYCRSRNFLATKVTLNPERFATFSQAVDVEEIQKYLHAFEQIAAGSKDAGPIGQLDKASRFRWLTATRSTVLQVSKVHPGLCPGEPLEALEKLHRQLVL